MKNHLGSLCPRGLAFACLSFGLLYAPVTRAGAFFETGAMIHPRSGGTATRLADGQVLVVGGRDSSTFQGTATAELYNPTTRSWQPTGSLGLPRLNHTATLLPDGRVLVAGGTSTNFVVPYFGTEPTAELYDPAAGTWSPTGNMNVARRSHTASLLANGTVL
ncbi:MAG: hypothetical protein KDM81_03775, partial [Verrucomicrobiae bacterium]|nr:hypothetical protein [Verrucomicrobiae bacterium]